MQLETDKKILGQIIRRHRKLANFTQSELAEKVGVNEKQISRIESGQNYPTYMTFTKLINVLDIELEQFYKADTKSGINSDTNVHQDSIKNISINMINNAQNKELKLYFDILRVLNKNLHPTF